MDDKPSQNADQKPNIREKCISPDKLQFSRKRKYSDNMESNDHIPTKRIQVETDNVPSCFTSSSVNFNGKTYLSGSVYE